MGREVRMVPKSWKHPKREDGSFIELFDSDFEARAAEWDDENDKWIAKDFPDYVSEESKKMSYSEWNGDRPENQDYMPSFEGGSASCLMMYETTTEGTPISPAFETAEELAQWLFDNNASLGWQTASYEGWLRVVQGGGYACSAVVSNTDGLQSGVDAIL